MKRIHLKFFVLFICLCIFPSHGLAKIVKGQAAITSSAEAAKAEAKKNALRELVENEVGVRLSSKTEVSMGMVVADDISLKSDGYVVINKIIREWQDNGVYFVELDATANAQRIETALQDLKSRLQAISDDENSRSGVQVAVVERDKNGRYISTEETKNYITYRLKSKGFSAKANDAVASYMISHASDPNAGLEARRIARTSGEEGNALLRGVLATEQSTLRPDGSYEVVVKASFEMIGLDSNAVDAYSDYFKAIDPSEGEAERIARDQATRAAVESLGKQAIDTVQSEMRGGNRNLKITINFSNMNNFAAQQQLITAGLQGAKCRVLRSARSAQNAYRVTVSTDAYSTLQELSEAIKKNISGLTDGIEDSKSLGSTKLNFTF